MFKFFRQYNKYIMVAGFTLLMLAFLVQPALNMFNRQPGDRPLGRVNGRTLTASQRQTAAAEINVLDHLAPALLDLTEQRDLEGWVAGEMGFASSPHSLEERRAHRDPLRWLLMLEEARAIGLNASQTDVNQMLTFIGRLDDAQLEEFAARAQSSPAGVRQALLDWAVVQQLEDLVRGVALVPPVRRFQYYLAVESELRGYLLRRAQEQEASGRDQPITALEVRYLTWVQVAPMVDSARENIRLSEPFLQRFMQDQRSSVKVSVVPVYASSKMDEVQAVPPDALTKLFDQYKDNLPGEGKPFPFGYRYPDRVKIEYLVFPGAPLRARAEVQEADALRYYQEHRDAFVEEVPATQPTTRPAAAEAATQPAAVRAAATEPAPAVLRPQSYEEVRQQIIEALQTQKTRELGRKMAKDAAAKLAQAQAPLTETDERGYKRITKGWTPRPLSEVAQTLQKDPQYQGLLPEVVSRADWLDRAGLQKIKGLGDAVLDVGLTGREHSASFVEYAASAKELKPPVGNALASMLRLQMGLVSAPLVNPTDDSFYLFRLTAAEPAHAPEAAGEVMPSLERDAKLLLAYQALKADLPRWRERVQTEKSMEVLAKEQGLIAGVLQPAPFPRRELSGGQVRAPDVGGVGRSEAFVDGVFAIADKVAQRGDIVMSPVALRSDALAVDDKLAVYLVRLDDFKAITFSDFLTELQQAAAYLPAEISQAQVSDLPADHDPLTLGNLKKRLHYVDETGRAEKQPTDSDQGD